MAMLSIGELALGSAASAGINTRIPWSALEYSAGTDVITSISGSSIGSTVDTSQLMPKSASGDFYPMTGNPSGFLTDDDLAPYAHESSLSGKMDKSASSEFYPMTGNPSGFVTGGPYQPSGDYVYESSFSAFSSNASASISSLSSIVSSISGNTGDYVEKSAISAESSKWNEVSGLSGKLDKSASSDFYSTSNPSGFISSADAATSFVYNSSYSSFSSETTGNISSLSSMVSAISGQTGDYVEKSSISAESAQWNEVSGLSGKLDSSASSSFYPMSGNPSGFLTEADVSSSYIPVSALETDENSAITGISGSAIAALTGDYVEKSAFHLQIGTGNIVLANTAYPESGTWAVIGSGNNLSEGGAQFVDSSLSTIIAGRRNSAERSTAIILGDYNRSRNEQQYPSAVNILAGRNNSSTNGLVAIGMHNTSQYSSVAIGMNLTSKLYSVAMGAYATVESGSLGIHVGRNPSVTDTTTVAVNSAYAIGRENTAYDSSVAIGQENFAGTASLALGKLNSATKSSNLYGYGLIGSDNLTVLGQWNSASAGSGNTAFVFGDGSGTGNRHDLMLLLRSGDIVINGSANSAFPVVSAITGLSSLISSNSAQWASGDGGTGLIPYSALEYSAGSTKITAISGSSIGAESINTAALVAGSGISIDLSGDGNYHINNTAPSVSALVYGGISASSYTDASGKEYIVLGLDHMGIYEGSQIRYAIQSSFQASAYEQPVPLTADQLTPSGYTSYIIKLDAIVSCPYGATWSLVETYKTIWNSTESAVIALDRTEGGNSAMVHLRGETMGIGNAASATNVTVHVKFDEAPVGDPTVTVHDQVGYYVRIPQGRIADGTV